MDKIVRATQAIINYFTMDTHNTNYELVCGSSTTKLVSGSVESIAVSSGLSSFGFSAISSGVSLATFGTGDTSCGDS